VRLTGRAFSVCEICAELRRCGHHRITTQRIEIVRLVDGGLLNLGRLIVRVDDVPLVVDRGEILCRCQDLLGAS